MQFIQGDGFILYGSAEPLNINQAFTIGLTPNEPLGALLSWSENGRRRSIYLHPIHDLARFRWTLLIRVRPLPWILPFDPTSNTSIFCPGCGLLVANWKIVWEHIGTPDHNLQRQRACRQFAGQVEYIRMLLIPATTAAQRQAVMNDTRSYIMGYNLERFITCIGDVSSWLYENIPEPQQLYHCPLCDQVFSNTIDWTVHMQRRLETATTTTCFRENRGKQILDKVAVFSLVAGNNADLMHYYRRWFRPTLAWANMTRSLLLLTFAKPRAWIEYWIQARRTFTDPRWATVIQVVHDRHPWTINIADCTASLRRLKNVIDVFDFN